MFKVKSFEVAEPLIEEATDRFKPSFKLNEESIDILKEYCSVIDNFFVEFNGTALDVEIDEIKTTIKFTITCSEVVITDKNHLFIELSEHAESLEFKVAEDGTLDISFTFPSLWEIV